MELLERFVRGDVDAFEALFREHERDVHGSLLRPTRDPAAAEDLTIEVFWRIYRAHARSDPGRSFGAWAPRIASNAALDHLRWVHLNRGTPATTVDRIGAAPLDMKIRVERAFISLPPRLRIVADLAFIQDWPHDEIVEALGISRSAVKSRAFRAMRHLKDALRREGVQPRPRCQTMTCASS